MRILRVLASVQTELTRQDEKWGAERDLGDHRWLRVLVEEVGESAAAIEDGTDLRAEVVQVAAVAIAWLEAMERRAEETPAPPPV